MNEKVAVYDLGGGNIRYLNFELGDGVFEAKLHKWRYHLEEMILTTDLLIFLAEEFCEKREGIDLRKIQWFYRD